MPKISHRRASDRVSTRPVRRKARLDAMTEATILTLPGTPRLTWREQRPKIAAGVLALALVGLMYAFFYTDQFYLFDVQVSGTKYLTQAEVEKTSGIVGYNIFFLETPAVERALKSLPEVQSVRITTAIPNHVTVEIQERQPQVIWVRGNETYWVDGSGTAFKARANLPGLPILRDLDQTPVKPGQPIQPPAILALQALRVAWPAAPRVIEWSTARGLQFNDEHGWRIYLGDASEMAGKVVMYRAIASQLVAQNAKIKFIDLGKGDPFYQ
jgi:cell division septal protein FtsQ